MIRGTPARELCITIKNPNNPSCWTPQRNQHHVNKDHVRDHGKGSHQENILKRYAAYKRRSKTQFQPGDTQTTNHFAGWHVHVVHDMHAHKARRSGVVHVTHVYQQWHSDDTMDFVVVECFFLGNGK